MDPRRRIERVRIRLTESIRIRPLNARDARHAVEPDGIGVMGTAVHDRSASTGSTSRLPAHPGSTKEYDCDSSVVPAPATKLFGIGLEVHRFHRRLLYLEAVVVTLRQRCPCHPHAVRRPPPPPSDSTSWIGSGTPYRTAIAEPGHNTSMPWWAVVFDLNSIRFCPVLQARRRERERAS